MWIFVDVCRAYARDGWRISFCFSLLHPLFIPLFDGLIFWFNVAIWPVVLPGALYLSVLKLDATTRIYILQVCVRIPPLLG